MTLKISRERCVEIAKDVASKRATMHSYYAEPFKPHQWVIDAMMEAAHEAASECDMPTMKWHGWKCSKGYKHKGPCEPTPSSSQPQPVAQGKAVAYRYRKRNCGGVWRYGSMSHRESGRGPNESVYEVEMLTRPCAATPTIPTGHRVVPVEDVSWQMLDAGMAAWKESVTHRIPHQSGTAVVKSDTRHRLKVAYKAMRAAAPDAGGV